MVRKNVMNTLLAVVALAAALTVFNAFMRDSGTAPESSASGRLATYLNLDSVKQDLTDTENAIVGEATTTTNQPTATVESTDQTPTVTVEPSQPETTQSTPATPAVNATAKPELVYTVKDGDTYGCIAEKYYGSYEHYLDVMTANPVQAVGFSEYSLHVGAQLVLPAVAQNDLKPSSTLCQ